MPGDRPFSSSARRDSSRIPVTAFFSAASTAAVAATLGHLLLPLPPRQGRAHLPLQPRAARQGKVDLQRNRQPRVPPHQLRSLRIGIRQNLIQHHQSIAAPLQQPQCSRPALAATSTVIPSFCARVAAISSTPSVAVIIRAPDG